MNNPMEDSLREGIQDKLPFMNSKIALIVLIAIGIFSLIGVIYLLRKKKA